MEGLFTPGGFQLPFQKRLSILYNDTKRSSDFVKESVRTEDDPELKSLHRKLKIQKDRLASWGLEWADPANQTADIDESLSNAGLSEVVGSIMSTIKDILAEAEPLWQSSKHIQDQFRPTGDKKYPILQWDKGRFEDLVRDLTSSIDTLYDVSRTRSTASARRPSKSMTKSADETRLYESSRRQVPQPIDPTILEHIQPLHRPSSEDRSVVVMSKTAWSDLMQLSASRQSWAPLLLEYARFDPMYASTGIMPDMNRFEKLSAGLQQDPQRSPDTWTGLPNLVGYFEDMENSRLGLLYRFPNSFNTVSTDKMTQHRTYDLPSLHDLLVQPDLEPAMEAKFRLAHNLANTVFDIHTRGIPHGKLSSHNISLCAHGSKTQVSSFPADQIDIRRPLLSSFDLFPEDMGTMPPSLTRHPQDPRSNTSSSMSRDTDERVLDLYSLAMVLLSVGLWEGVESLAPELSTGSMSEALSRRLSIRCGTLYTKAVQTCWSALDDLIAGVATSEDILSDVQVRVSRYLEACCILDGVSGLESRLEQELHPTVSSPKTMRPEAPPPPPPAGPSMSLRDVKSAAASVAATFSHANPPSSKSAMMAPPPPPPSRRLRSPAPIRYEPVDSTIHQTQKPEPPQPEIKMRLYPHVPLPADAVQKWNTTLMPQINMALRSFYKKHPESVEISLESVGPSPTSTKPTVVVVCTSVGKVRAILKKKLADLFEGPGSVGLKVCRGSVVRSRRQDDDNRRSIVGARRSAAESGNGKSVAAVNPEYEEKPSNGASIGAWIGDKHLPPVSFGGLVMVDNRTYGMTVHHMLDDPETNAPPEDPTRSMADLAPASDYAESLADSVPPEDYGFGLSDTESEYYSDTDLTSEYDDDSVSEDEFEEGDRPGIEAGCGDGFVVTQPAMDDIDDDFFPSSETANEDHIDSHGLGHVYASSGIRRKEVGGLLHEIDWALFAFDEARLPAENSIPRLTSKQAQTAQQLRPMSVVPASSLPGTEVQCRARTSGLQTGTVLPALTSVKIYGRQSPSHTYQVTSRPSTTTRHMGIPGDSGAWIMSRKNGDLCGHVLAWSSRKQVAYICPMDVLFADIADTLDATTVCLPSVHTEVTPAMRYAAEVKRNDTPMSATLCAPFSSEGVAQELSAVDLLALQMADLDRDLEEKELPPLPSEARDDGPAELYGSSEVTETYELPEATRNDHLSRNYPYDYTRTEDSGLGIRTPERSLQRVQEHKQSNPADYLAREMAKLAGQHHLPAGSADEDRYVSRRDYDNVSLHSSKTVRPPPQGLLFDGSSGGVGDGTMLMRKGRARSSQLSSRSGSARGSPRSGWESPMMSSVSVA